MSQAGITTPKSGGGGSGVQTLTGNTGGAVGPTGNNINIVGTGTITVTGTPGTSTLTISSSAGPITDLHITPYIVSAGGSANGASYTTIQAAVNAANAAGGGAVYIQQGTYVESLTLYDQVNLVGVPAISQGVNEGVLIEGVHTPPTSGHVLINGVGLASTTSLFTSNAAGSTHLTLANCEFAVQNGYTFNLPNWTGTLEIYDCNPFMSAPPWGINDGGINNTGGSTIVIYNSGVGNGTNVMTISGPNSIFGQAVTVGCPLTMTTGSDVTSIGSLYNGTVTLSGNATLKSYNDSFVVAGGNPAITMNSSNSALLSHATIDSTSNPAITGTGAGMLTYVDVSFINNASFAGTLTLGRASWQPYAKAAASSVATNVGTASFNSAQFTVDTNGFVSAAGAGIPTTITGNSGGALSPTANNWNIFGAAVAAGSTPVTTVGSGSTLTVEVQRTQAIASTNASNVGLAAFNSAQFSVDGNGFVSSLNSVMAWNDEAVNFNAVATNGYFITAGLTATLPASPSQGNTISFVVDAGQTLTITANTGQIIRIGSAVSATAGTAASNAWGDSVTLVYRASDTAWIATSVIGNWTVT
jgi:hypothetical protein